MPHDIEILIVITSLPNHLWWISVIMWSHENAIETIYELKHWGRDKIDTIFQTTFLNGFSWMKIYEIWIFFFLNLFVRVVFNTKIFIWSPRIDQKIFFFIKPIMILLAQI